MKMIQKPNTYRKLLGSLFVTGLLLSGCQAPTAQQHEGASSEANATETTTTTNTQETTTHTHSHGHDGTFRNIEVQDRALTDWAGDWQSIYPYLEAGTLDEVFTAKAQASTEGKTAEAYFAYYQTGYQTTVESLKIEDTQITFVQEGGTKTGTYTYEGFEILTYDSGKKGVRYLFTNQDTASEAPRYIQFSDHQLKPTKVEHFHLYMGDESHEALLTEVENWPTYYPAAWSGTEITADLLAH